MPDVSQTGPPGGGMMGYTQSAAGAGDRSTGSILQDIIASGQEIMRSEVKLAKAELREEATKAAKGAAMLAAGGVLALFALGFLLSSLVDLIAANGWMDRWVAALVVAVVVGAVAAFLALRGKEQLQHVEPTPHKTIENVKENIEWAKHQTKS